MRFYFIALIVIIADRITKWLVLQHLTVGESIQVVGEQLVRFTLVLNPGIAFGFRIIPSTYLLVFHLVTSLVLIVYLYYIRQRKTFLKLPLSLILGGAIGNVIDRILYGEVIDFIDCDFPNIIISRWPVFNIADSAVSTGMVLLAIYLFFLSHTEAESLSPPTSSTTSNL